MKEYEERSISERVNEFIESLGQDANTIQVVKVSKVETIILYEDWSEHPPIKNYEPGSWRTRRHTPESKEKIAEVQRGKPKSPETRAKISEAMKGKKHSDIHNRRLRARKVEYYQKLREQRERDENS